MLCIARACFMQQGSMPHYVTSPKSDVTRVAQRDDLGGGAEPALLVHAHTPVVALDKGPEPMKQHSAP